MGSKETLTYIQKEILQKYADGYSNNDIAKETNRHIKTIEMHSQEIKLRLDAINKTQAVAIGIRKEIIE